MEEGERERESDYVFVCMLYTHVVMQLSSFPRDFISNEVSLRMF